MSDTNRPPLPGDLEGDKAKGRVPTGDFPPKAPIEHPGEAKPGTGPKQPRPDAPQINGETSEPLTGQGPVEGP
jgi:hypothetical protein